MVEKCCSFLELYETGYSIYASNARALYQKPKANLAADLLLKSVFKIFPYWEVSKIKKLSIRMNQMKNCACDTIKNCFN